MFWFVATVLIMITMLAIYVPLNRATKTDTTKSALVNALAAELGEINADKGERFSNFEELQAARAEVGRRLLALEGVSDQPVPPTKNAQLFAVFALVPILAIPLYLQLGQPEYADQSFAARIDNKTDDGQQEVTKLIERVEERLKQKPDDAEGWAVVAPVYFRLGRFDDSLNAYTKAIEFHKGTTLDKSRLMADRAEIMVAKADGKVAKEASVEFNAALGLDPENQKALFYAAIFLEQTGNANDAKANWQTLIARFKTVNPPWLVVAERRLAALGGTVPPKAGPTPDQVEAASGMTPEQRQNMIKGMVDGLAAKLKQNPQDQSGWVKLIRARVVMNDQAQAVLDLETARSLFATGTQGRTEIDTLAQSLGL